MRSAKMRASVSVGNRQLRRTHAVASATGRPDSGLAVGRGAAAANAATQCCNAQYVGHTGGLSSLGDPKKAGADFFSIRPGGGAGGDATATAERAPPVRGGPEQSTSWTTAAAIAIGQKLSWLFSLTNAEPAAATQRVQLPSLLPRRRRRRPAATRRSSPLNCRSADHAGVPDVERKIIGMLNLLSAVSTQ